jgi:hypothetical protein
MPVFTRIGYLIAGAISVAVFGTSIIGSGYSGVVLTHLADIVNGANTSAVVSTNAPNWEVGTPLPVVQGIAAATSTSGTLASSTIYNFEVSAVDAQGGTTTVSSIASATTDQTASDSILVKWGAIPGAVAYAVYFATTSTSSLSQYFYATTSSQYIFATSTGSLSGSYTKLDTTAFSTIVNPAGPSYFEGGNGTATSSPAASTTALQVNGNFVVSAPATTTACYAGTAGAIFYNTSNGHEWGCSGTTWVKIF